LSFFGFKDDTPAPGVTYPASRISVGDVAPPQAPQHRHGLFDDRARGAEVVLAVHLRGNHCEALLQRPLGEVTQHAGRCRGHRRAGRRVTGLEYPHWG
jgi:hypothetical protein